jgi:hypothetical protein
MPHVRIPYLSLLAVWVAGAILIGPRRVAADPPIRRLVLVVARSSPVTDLSSSDLKRLFTGSAVSSGGTRLVPFNFPPGSRERLAFDRAVLGMTGDEAGRFWVDRKIRGQSAAPRALPSGLYVAKVVAKLPGAIGYIAEDQLTAALRPVRIGGVAHTDPGYPILMK